MNNTKKDFWRTIAVVAALVAAIVAVAIFTGCASAPRGVKVVASSASATNLGDINWDEYKIPVFSVVSGPRSTVWINKDYLALKRVKAGGSVTNDTSFIALYADKSGRENFIEMEFQVTTNAVESATN